MIGSKCIRLKLLHKLNVKERLEYDFLKHEQVKTNCTLYRGPCDPKNEFKKEFKQSKFTRGQARRKTPAILSKQFSQDHRKIVPIAPFLNSENKTNLLLTTSLCAAAPSPQTKKSRRGTCRAVLNRVLVSP